MTFVLAIFPLLLSTTLPSNGSEVDRPAAVTADGGEVPIVAPSLTPAMAKLLAPELVADGGQNADGTQAPMVVPTKLSVYNVDLPVEAGITLSSFGLYFMVDILVKPSLEGDISCRRFAGNGRCNPADLSSFDRYAVGKSSKTWKDFSDVALASSLIIPSLYLALESFVLPTREPWGDWANDALVITEALALSASLQTVLKFAFRRPRPARYLDFDPPTSSFDQELSMPSGHVTMVTAAMMALSTTVAMRHPESKVRFAVLGAGIALSLLTAVSRVESGQHFPTDVITGLVVGGFAGFVVPYLHRKKSSIAPSVAFNPTTGTTMFAIAGAL